ncbi:MAG: FliM/FliN family flagellar motor switch protein [Bryobacteraceae bacterium]
MANADALARMLDIPLEIDVSVDGPTLTLSQILALRVGTVVATQKRVGEEFGIFAANTQVGFGEIAVSQNRVFVRMTRFAGRR